MLFWQGLDLQQVCDCMWLPLKKYLSLSFLLQYDLSPAVSGEVFLISTEDVSTIPLVVLNAPKMPTCNS